MAVTVISRDELLIFDSSPDLGDVRQFLANPRFRLEGWRAGLVVHGAAVRGGTPPNPSGPARPGAVSLFGSHARDDRGEKGGRGWSAIRLRDAIAAAGGNIHAVMSDLANERPGVSLQGVTRVELHLWRAP